MTFAELNREKQYRGHVFDVAQVRVRLPDGRERDYDLVEHGDSVTILPVDDHGNILFVSQHRLGSGGQLLELPAGVLDPGESPLVSAKRELREETGMAAREINELGGFYLAPGYTDEYMTVFLATGLYDSPLDADEDEFLNLKTLSIHETYQKARSGGLQDGKPWPRSSWRSPFWKNLPEGFAPVLLVCIVKTGQGGARGDSAHDMTGFNPECEKNNI